MARGRRRGSGRMRADWVYRSDAYRFDDPTEDTPDANGTYYTPFNIGAGQSNATAQVLYDSAMFVGGRFAYTQDAASGDLIRAAIGPEARPDSDFRGPLIHGCDIGIYYHIERSSWSVVGNSHLFFGARIVVARQDAATGQMTVDPTYSMWSNTTGEQPAEPSIHANGRQNCWEHRHYHSAKNSDDASYIDRQINFRPRFKRRLEAFEALFLYIELHPNSTALEGANFMNLWCRTLVTDTNRT